VTFTRTITDVISTSPWRRRNGGTPVGYSGGAALRRKQCDMTAESGIVERIDGAIARQRRGKHISSATNQHATTEGLLEAAFWSLLRPYSEDQPLKM
jgi:hypothetical protein